MLLEIDSVLPPPPLIAPIATSGCLTVQIFIKLELLANAPTITLDVNLDDLVSGVKAKIRAKVDVPESHQRLNFAGKELSDEQTLSMCGVQKGSTVRALGRLRAGMDPNGHEDLAVEAAAAQAMAEAAAAQAMAEAAAAQAMEIMEEAIEIMAAEVEEEPVAPNAPRRPQRFAVRAANAVPRRLSF